MPSRSDINKPLQISFTNYDPADERRRESLLALGNGMLFVRACAIDAETGDTCHYPGTYRAGHYDRRGLQLEGRTLGHDSLVNLPNWLPLDFRLANDTEWVSLRRCEVLDYLHRLDMAAGIAERRIRIRDAKGRITRLHEQRAVSMVRPALAVLRLELTAENWSGPLRLRAAIDGRISNGNTDHRMLAGYRHIRVTGSSQTEDGILVLTARTRHADTGLAIAVQTRSGSDAVRRIEHAAETVTEYLFCNAQAGQMLVFEKVAAIVTGRDPATGSPMKAACATVATAPDFDSLGREHTAVWRRIRERIGIEAAAPELRQGLAFHAFHLLQTLSPHSVQLDVGFPSRGWQEAYHGQIFWDEIFVFPFLNHRFPEIARGLLLYRYRRLPAARRAACAAGYAGAMFPWRSATTGDEETPGLQVNALTGRWMHDHTSLQRHIGAAIAHNVWHYYFATGDQSFLIEYGAEMMIEIARFWASIVRHDPAEDRYDILGVIGPDEYHTAYPDAAQPGLNNNAYTNVMAAVTLRRARMVLDILPHERRRELTEALALTDAEIAHWDRVARRLRLCFHADGVLSQFDGFDRLKPFDGKAFAQQHPNGRLDWELDKAGDTINAYQATKQPDVLMLLYLLLPEELLQAIRTMGYAMEPDSLRLTLDYYLARLTHESSLSMVVCAGALARFDRGKSWDFFMRSLCIDLSLDNSQSAEEGLHLGAMAGTLDVLQRHYLGIRVDQNDLVLTPSVPEQLGPVGMCLRHGGALLQLDWNGRTLQVTADASNQAPVPIRTETQVEALNPGGELTIEAP